ncbi:polysaccharide biosynthesis protein [Priestia megaterium]|nr:polysaccharide biosynthesis protein [Priestia megaterium]
MSKKSQLYMIVNGAVILTIAGILTKILSATYRIPYHHIAGDIGFYIYQQAYPLYGIALQLSTYGFPVIISKLISEQAAMQNKIEITKIIQISFGFLVILSCTMFVFQYTLADEIALLMGDRQLTLLIEIIAFSFLFIPFVAVIRGYYQGLNNMIPTAISQVAEQIIRVATILCLSFLLIQQGYDLYMAGAAAIFGSITGVTIALIVLLFFVLRERVGEKWTLQSVTIKETMQVLRKVAIQGSFICLSGMGLLLIQLTDSFTLYSSLTANGVEHLQAKVMKGIYDRGLPLIQLGTVVGTAFSLSLVPTISAAIAKNDWKFVTDKIKLSLKLSLVVGVGAALGLIGLMKPINIMLYGDAAGTDVLQILSLLVIFTTLSATTAAILQGMGHTVIPVFSVVIGMGVKLFLNLWLVPLAYTHGAAVASAISFGCIAIVNGIFLYKFVKIPLAFKKMSVVVVMIGLCMLGLLQGYLWLIEEVLFHDLESMQKNLVAAFAGVCIGGSFYLWLLIRKHVFTFEELTYVPLGHAITKYILRMK